MLQEDAKIEETSKKILRYLLSHLLKDFGVSLVKQEFIKSRSVYIGC